MHPASDPPDSRSAAASRTDRRFVRAQAISGIALTLFASIHLLNTALAAFPGTYDRFQRVIRLAYQSPVLEVLLVLVPLLVHVVAAVRAMIRRRSRTADAPLRTRLHRYAGWYLLLVMAGHVLATRGASLGYDVYPAFIGLQFSIAWLPWLFLPYYALLGVSGVVHVTHGVRVALGILHRPLPKALTRPTTFWPLVIGGALAMLIGVAGIAGWLYPTQEDPFASDYAGIYRGMAQWWFVPEVPMPQE